MRSFCTPLAWQLRLLRQAGRQQQLVVGAKASGRDARDAAKRELAIVFKDWRSALAYSVGGELFKQTDGRETRRVQSAHYALVESTNIHIHTYIYTHTHIYVREIQLETV